MTLTRSGPGSGAAHAGVPEADASGYVGLDIGHAEVVACLLLPDGREAVPRWAVPNTAPGAHALADRLAVIAQEHELRHLRIGLEATGIYWWHLACFLHDSALLAPWQPRVYALNPQLVHGLRRLYPQQGKTDRRDAFVIAERVRLGRLPAPFQIDVLYAPLQRLTRFRTHLAHTLVREKNYFLSVLFLKFSAFSDAFTDPFSTTGMAVLETFTPEELAQASLDDLAAFIQKQGWGRFADPAAVAATLARAARDSYRLDQVLAEPVTLILGTTMATIRALQTQLQALDKTIAQELLAIPPDRRTIASIPGLGPVWTAGLVAEIGHIQRFPNDAALANFAGLVWPPRESGSFQAEDTALSKAGNTYLRYYLVEAANSARLHCTEYRAYYQAKLAQSPAHAHRRALVLTARKLVRLVDALLRDSAVYQSPEARQDWKEGRTHPHMARPRTHRHTPLVAAAAD